MLKVGNSYDFIFLWTRIKRKKRGFVCLGFFHLVRVCMLSFSRVQPFATLWTEALQALLSVGFSGQEDWSGLPFPPSGDLPHPVTEPASLMPPAGRQVPYPRATNFIYWLMHCAEGIWWEHGGWGQKICVQVQLLPWWPWMILGNFGESS